MKYAVVIEPAPGKNYSAYVPDLPGCVSTGDTVEEVSRNIQEAVQFHLEGMRSDGWQEGPDDTTMGWRSKST
jgi:predicted RNase H-like HicB family nuclease